MNKVALPKNPVAPMVEASTTDAVVELQVAVTELRQITKTLFEQMRRAGIAQ